jgi:hypothetical protein
VCAVVAVGGAGVVSILTTFTRWEAYREGRTGWQLFINVGETLDVESNTYNGSAFTGWATLLAGVFLIALAVLRLFTIDRKVRSTEARKILKDVRSEKAPIEMVSSVCTRRSRCSVDQLPGGGLGEGQGPPTRR